MLLMAIWVFFPIVFQIFHPNLDRDLNKAAASSPLSYHLETNMCFLQIPSWFNCCLSCKIWGKHCPLRHTWAGSWMASLAMIGRAEKKRERKKMPSFPPKVVHLHFYPPVPVILRSGTDFSISFKWTWSIKTDIWNMNLYFSSCLYPDWRHWCSPAKPKKDHLPKVTCQTNAPCSLHATMLSIPLRKDEDMPQGFSL